jgi:hypothetical protein
MFPEKVEFVQVFWFFPKLRIGNALGFFRLIFVLTLEGGCGIINDGNRGG